ncbi:hypothetical protein Tco_0714220 [Tanacetum coccineum]
MWEEFTQSIHTFTYDKKNLAQHTLGKKKATLILILSIIVSHSHLKFSAKGSKREVFGMTIPNELINDVIRGADYYDAYLEKVAKHQRYIAGEELSDPESPAPKPAKPTKQAKPKATEQPTVSKTITKQPTVSKTKAKKSKPALAKPREKKHKPVSEPSKISPLAKRAKGVKEPDTGKLNHSQKVPGKGKRKVCENKLLTFSTPSDTKKKEPTEIVISFSRNTLDPLNQRAMKVGQKWWLKDEGQLDQTLVHVKTRMTAKADPNPDDVGDSQPLPTPSILAGPNLEHSIVEITDLSSQPPPEHMDEGFIAVAYPDVQENLKLTVDEQVIPEEPVSSTGTLSSLQHLAKDFSFGDQFLNDKPSEADNE